MSNKSDDPEIQKALIQAAALKAVKKMLPVFHDYAKKAQIMQAAHDNSKRLAQQQNKDKKHRNRMEIRKELTANFSSKEIAEFVDCGRHTARRIRSQTVPLTTSNVIRDHSTKLCDEEQKLYKEYFENKTEVRSGSSTQLRQLTVSKHDLMFDLFASFPQLLRQQCKSNQQLLLSATQAVKKTRYQVALIASSTPRWESPDDEYLIRHCYIKQKYKKKLEDKQSQKKRLSIEPKKFYKTTAQSDLWEKVNQWSSEIQRLQLEKKEMKATLETMRKTKDTDRSTLSASSQALQRKNIAIQQVCSIIVLV